MSCAISSNGRVANLFSSRPRYSAILPPCRQAVPEPNSDHLACCNAGIHSGSSFSWFIGRICCGYVHRDYRTIPFLWHADSDRTDLSPKLQERPVQLEGFFQTCRDRGLPVDRVHHNHLLPAERKSCYVANPQLYTCSCWHRCCLDVWNLVLMGEEMVYWTHQTDSG